MILTKKLWWAYFVELFLSSLIVLLAILVFGQDAVADFSRNIGMSAVTLLGGAILTAALGMIMLIFQRLDAPFYRWLEGRGALKNYLNAFKFVALLCVLSIILVIVLDKNSSSRIFAIVVTYILALLAVNALTLINNIVELISLELAFIKKMGS